MQPTGKQEKKWCFIVNPQAGGGRAAREWAKIATKLKENGIDAKAHFTERKMHAAALAKKAIENGSRHIVAVGGDGTAHEVVNGIFQQDACPAHEVTFCLLPIGTGNDWIKTHRIPKNTRAWLDCLTQGKTVLHDVGFVFFQNENRQREKRFFINVAGLSYDGYVAQQAQGRKAVFFHKLFYLEMTLRCLFRFRIPRLSVVFNGQKKEGRLLTVNAGVCRYSGGGMQLTPHAQPSDGYLALTVAGRINPFVVLLVSPLFYLGKIGWHPKVEFFQTKQIVVSPAGNDPVLVEADGEFLGEAPAELGILPGALRVVVGH